MHGYPNLKLKPIFSPKLNFPCIWYHLRLTYAPNLQLKKNKKNTRKQFNTIHSTIKYSIHWVVRVSLYFCIYAHSTSHRARGRKQSRIVAHYKQSVHTINLCISELNIYKFYIFNSGLFYLVRKRGVKRIYIFLALWCAGVHILKIAEMQKQKKNWIKQKIKIREKSWKTVKKSVE